MMMNITTTTTTTTTKGWAPGRRWDGSNWTYPTNTSNPKCKQGVVLDRFGWIEFGQKRFEFRKFIQNKSPFHDGQAFIDALKKRGFEQLGNGAFSTVLGKPGKDRVIKVTRRPDGWIDYAKWGATTGSSFVPKVFSYKKISGKKKDFEVAIMERLEYTFYKAPEDHALRILPDLLWKSENNPMAARFAETLAPGVTNYMKGIYDKFGRDGLDLHNGNYMIRKDGSFVVTDPICDGPKTEYKRLRAGDFSPVPLFDRKDDRFLVEMRN